jgi:hypothetical protein
MADGEMNNAQYYLNRTAIEAATVCGCFCCMKIFRPSLITKWTDSGETACCPYCGLDTVLPGNDDNPLDAEEMVRFRQRSMTVTTLLSGDDNEERQNDGRPE